jgi:hypothetical protein
LTHRERLLPTIQRNGHMGTVRLRHVAFGYEPPLRVRLRSEMFYLDSVAGKPRISKYGRNRLHQIMWTAQKYNVHMFKRAKLSQQLLRLFSIDAAIQEIHILMLSAHHMNND